MADEVIQVVVAPPLRPALEEWLAGRGLKLAQMPSDPDDLPTFVVTPVRFGPDTRYCPVCDAPREPVHRWDG